MEWSGEARLSPTNGRYELALSTWLGSTNPSIHFTKELAEVNPDDSGSYFNSGNLAFGETSSTRTEILARFETFCRKADTVPFAAGGQYGLQLGGSLDGGDPTAGALAGKAGIRAHTWCCEFVMTCAARKMTARTSTTMRQ